MSEQQSTTATTQRHGGEPHPHPVNIIIEVNGRNKPVQFETAFVTGRQIRVAADVPLTDDLTRLVHGKPTGGNIGLDAVIEIHNGDHFIALPTGVVS